MTLPATPRKAGPFTGTGVQTDFPFTFKVFAEADVRVVLADVDGIETDQVLFADYTVALNPDQDTTPGGTVTMLTAPATGERLVLLGDIDYDQPFDVPDGGSLRTVALENQLDRTIMQLQQLLERIGRTVRLAPTGVLQDLVFPQPSQGDLIGWNNTSDTLVNYDPLDILQLAGSSGFQYRAFTGNGVLTSFNLGINPGSLANLFVYISGVRQTPVTDYSFNLTTLQFTAAPPNGTTILAVFGETLGIGIPSFGSVTSDKLDPAGVAIPIGSTLPANIVGRSQLADDAVGTNEIENLAVTEAKIGNLAVSAGKIVDLAVTTNKLANGGVTTAKVGDDQVTYAKLQNIGLQSVLGNGTTLAGDAREISISTGFTHRNRIINGACNVAQRPSSNFSVGIIGYAGPDRYNGTNVGAGGSFTQAQGTLTVEGVTDATIRQTVGSVATNLSAGNYWSGISQLIEGFNCYDLVGKPVVISFVFNTNVTGTYTVSLRDAGGGNSFVTTFAATASVPLRVVIPLPAVPGAALIPRSSGIGMILNIGGQNTGTFQTTANPNAWQAGNFFAASGATNWSTTLGAAIEATQIQLEVGTNNTPFERLSHPVVVGQCQRYYEVGTLQQPIVQLTYMAGQVTYNTNKRVAGTVSFTDLVGNVGRFSSGGSNNLVVGAGGLSPSTEGFFVDILPSVALTAANNWWRFLWFANCEL